MRFIQFSFFSFIGFLIIQCASLSETSRYGLRAPSSVTDEGADIVTNYQRYSELAHTEKTAEDACQGFLEISKKDELPEQIKQLALVRAAAVCPKDVAKESLVTLGLPPAWLKEEFINVQLKISQKTGEPIEIASSLNELAQYQKTQGLQIQMLEKALALISKNKGPEAKQLRQLIQTNLVTIAPRYYRHYSQTVKKIPPLLIRARDHQNAREFTQARKIYLKIAKNNKSPVTDRLKAYDGYRMTYKLELNTPKYIQATKKWLKFAQNHLLYPGLKKKNPVLIKAYMDVAVSYARAIWTDHQPKLALKFLEHTERVILQKKLPLSLLYDSILTRARIAEEKGEFQKMDGILSSMNIETLSDRAQKAKILWHTGWNQRRLKSDEQKSHLERAIRTLESANQFEDSTGSYSRNLYWIARFNQELGKTDIATKIFNELYDQYQFGYYGVLAAKELGKSLSPLNKASEETIKSDIAAAEFSDDLKIPLGWFISLGELDIGKKFLQSFAIEKIWNKSEPKMDLSAQDLMLKKSALQIFANLQMFYDSTVRLNELSPKDSTTILLETPFVLFPTPYTDLVKENAAKQETDPALIYSIMRQESLFDPYARSSADAFGLMQLIPSVAKNAARNLETLLTTPEELYRPEINIALGTFTLKSLFKKYDDRFILAVAAYNANDRAIQGWLRTRMRQDPIEFIEEIPYEETRNYIKLVLRNLVTYQRLLSSEPVSFPTWTLKL